MQNAIERYLKEKNYPLNIVRSREFQNSQEILHTKGNFSATTGNDHHWFLTIASNSKVKCTRQWDLIVIFRQLVLQDFHQVVPHSFNTAWQLLNVLIVLLHHRITPAVLIFFSVKETRCLSHNRRRSEGLILLSQTTRIKL